MVTIKDIAKAAGVAQGTVSNVLNGRGNVSSEKIRHVLEVSEALGYVPNERAKMLRKGNARTLGVLLPNPPAQHELDFYYSFKIYAESHGYRVRQYLPRSVCQEAEEAALQEARSDMVAGMAVFSACLHQSGYNPVESAGPEMRLLFVERRPGFEAAYIGFDYERAGRDMAEKALQKGYRHVGLITDTPRLSHAAAFYRGFTQRLEGTPVRVTAVQTNERRRFQNVLEAGGLAQADAVFASSLTFAQTVRDVLTSFYAKERPVIYTVSPIFTLPEMDFHKYELNYRLLGNTAARMLVRQIEKKQPPESRVMDNAGFRSWLTPCAAHPSPAPINVLTLDSPTAYILRHMARLYTRQTQIPINITIYTYNEIYEAFNNLRDDAIFDVLRLDVTWLSCFAERILCPLEEIDPSISGLLGGFLSGTAEQYAYVNGVMYAVPNTPSTQMLFYRRDLFTSAIYRRMYQEMHHQELGVPQTFEDFNRVAAFFTKAINPESPVDYGATLTFGSTGVAGSEYLSRLFGLQENLYQSNGEIRLNSATGVRALEQLIEMKRFSDPQYCTWWTNTAATFAQGNVAMAILYNNFAAPLLSHRSRVQDSIGYAMVPGGRPVIGGGALGVSRFSRQPEKALDFIRWLSSEPVASACTLLGGVSPCKQSYDNYEIINNYPWLKLVKSCFGAARGRRMPPECTAPFDERRFMSIIGMAVKNAYSGALTPQAAMDYAQKLFEEQFAQNLAQLKSR